MVETRVAETRKGRLVQLQLLGIERKPRSREVGHQGRRLVYRDPLPQDLGDLHDLLGDLVPHTADGRQVVARQ